MKKAWAAAGVIVAIVFLSARVGFPSSQNQFTALSAEADPHTGSANFSVPVDVPPGRAGIQPNIQLQYNSSAPNGILGVGWNLELGAVQRSAKGGVPRYDDTDTFLLIQNGGVQELVLDTATGLYRGKVEGAFMKIERLGGYWEVTDKNGTQYFFGETTSAREYDPDDTGRVFKWYLNKVEDPRGNNMTIEYFRDENKLYPQDIRYTGNSQKGLSSFAHVVFEREPRPENEIDRYNTGFRMSARYRISRITVSVDGSLQKKYDLVYTGSKTTERSLLTSIVQFGSDGLSSLPPMAFSYQTPKNPDFNYAVTSMNNAVAGDNLWNYRYDSGYDRGHENYGPCPPTNMCNSVNWGPISTKGDGTGNVSFSSGQDTAHWLWTYLYVDKAVTLSVPYTTGGVDGVWVNTNGNYSQSVGPSWSLQAGYNLVEITLYHQHEGFGFNLNYAPANNVDLMSSSSVILPQISGDFNADGRTDIATFTSTSGKVEVERSSGTSFSPKETWASGFVTNGKLVLGDFNGDGRMDISGFDPASGNWRVAFSDGSRFNDSGVWLSGFGAGEDPATGDFNGDGLTDILTFYKSSGSLYVRIALNKGTSFAALSGGQTILIGSSGDTPIVGDFNGDGQVDFGAFNKTSGNWDVRLNTGDILAGLRQLAGVSGFGAGRNTVVSDFNYDGLTDIGYYDDATGKVIYRVSTGLSFAAATELPFVFNIKGPNTQIQSGDYNGDTLVDFAVYNLIGKLEIAFSNGVMPDILSSVENGLGGQSSITYNAAVNYPQTFLPFPIQVVKSITQSNGLGESYTINNSYEQGLWDALKREFRGFGLVRVTDPDGNYVDTVFAQDGIYKGRVLEQRVYDASGSLYSKTVNTWANQEIIPGSNFIYLQRKDNFIYDGDATGRRTAEEFSFEETPQLGNLTKAVQWGEVDLATGGDIGNDTHTVETAYVQDTSGGNWIVGLPRLTTVKDNAGNIVRQAWFYYDNQGNTATPIKGLLTKKEDWAGGAPGAVNPVTRYSYDMVGNLLTTTDPKGNITRVTYDTTYNMFPLTTENALGHKVINEYYGVNGVALSDASGLQGLWGQLKSTTDLNNQNGKRVYDVFGRGTAVVSPLDSIALPTQTTAIEFLGSYTKVTIRQRVDHGKAATIDTVSFIDGFGRLAQAKARSEVNGRYVINGQAQYDSRGLKSRQYLPAFSTNPMDVIDAIDTAKPNTLITYDAMGRPVKTTNPDGTFANVSYDNWTTTATDENGHMQKSYFDAYGRLIKKEEYLGADGRSPYYPAKPYTLYATTLYLYDSEGNLTQTQDAYGNTTTITYDSLGRKTAMDDPDMGHWSYQYDINGNLISQTDAKGQTLVFTYDALNRLTNKTDGVNGMVNVNYTYDNATASNFAKGRLTQATYSGGNTQFAYDELGRELQSVKEMNARAFEVNRGYDALSRLTDIQYPQGENIVYNYNAAGQIESVTNDPSLVPPVTLNAPELYLIQTGSTEVKLSWGSVVEATGYKIKYGTSSGNYTMTLDAGSALNKVITGLTNDTTYYFVVAAYNATLESGSSNERSATPAAPAVITMPSPWVQYAFNDNASNTNVADTAGALYPAITEQTSSYTSDLTGSGTASASSYLNRTDCDGGPCYPYRAFDNDTTNWDGWVADGTKSGWLAYEFSSMHKINQYVIAPRGHIYPNDDGNPHNWTFEGFNGSGWDVLDTRSYSSWSWQSPVTFNFANDTAYNKYRLNISANGGHVEVGLTEMEMMAYAPLYTNAISSAGVVNASFNLNGANQLVNADTLLAAKNHVVGTIALWVNPSSPSSGDVIFSISDTDGQNRVELRAANDLEFYIANSAISLRVSLPNALIAGLWSHVALVQDSNGIKGYINGSEAAVTVLDQSLGLDAWFNSTWGLDNARVGCAKNNNQGNHNYYGGQLDDFRYYNYPLKAAEVKALYNGGSGTEAKNPQYTEYTPLSKVEKGSWPLEKIEALAFKYEIRSTKHETKSNDQNINDQNTDVLNLKNLNFGFVSDFGFRISNLLAWMERTLLGVGEAYAEVPMTAGRGGYWAFDEAAGTTASDSSGSGYTGTLVNMEETDHVGGKVAGALDFDGSYEYVTMGSPANWSVGSAVTAAAWVKIDTDTHGRIITKHSRTYGDYGFMLARYLNNDSLEWRISTTGQNWIGGTTSSNSFVVGQWYHVAATYDGSMMRVYMNGVENTGGSFPKALTGNVRNSTASLYVGRDSGTGYLFNGLIDEVRVYDRALSSSEVMDLYQFAGASPVTPPVLDSAVPGDGQVSLSWNAIEGALGGYIIRYGKQSGVYGDLRINAGGTTTYTVTGLTNGTTYYFIVETDTNTGLVTSNEVSATPAAPPPPAPVLNSAVPGNSQVDLSWGVVTGATGYKVYRGTASGVYGTPTDVGSVTNYTVTGLTNGTKYYFAVTAYSANGESSRSNELSATLVAPAPTVTLTVEPSTITAGESATLIWSSTNADECLASGGWTGLKAVSGTTDVAPAATTTYTLTCGGPGGTASASAEVVVNPLIVQETPALYVKNVDYNAAGQMTKIEYGNGDVTLYSYNPLTLRLIRLYTVDKNGNVLQDLNYTYDSVGNILSIDDKVNTAGQTFQYDELNRLTQAVGGYGTKSYVYDALGNIVEKDGRTYFYGEGGAGPHAVTSLSDGTTFGYDANGNMVSKTESGTVTAYTYDAENRLTKVVKNGSTIGQYEYDGDGGRTKKTATVFGQTTTTTFVGSLFETSGLRNTKFIFLGGQRVAAVTNSPSIGSTTLYYHADHLGGANVLTDATGFKKELIEYEPFGQESRHEKYGSSEEVAWYYFTGKKTDDESGLIYFGARYYDPSLGRFITPDTVIPGFSNPQALNRYSYCLNNPINRIDPDGHWSWKKFFKSFVSTFVQIATTIVLTPFIGPIAAGAVGGFVGGALNAGLNGASFGQAMMSGLVGAGIGALGGAAFGTNGVNGFLGSWGPGVGIGLLVAGGAYSAATGNLDSFAGGLIGGIGGYVAGQGVLDSGALKNNPSVKAYKQAQIQAQKNNQSMKTDEAPHPKTNITLRAEKVYEGNKFIGVKQIGQFYPSGPAQGGEPVFRIYGGGSLQRGSSWMPLDPRNIPNVQDIMGLPPENSAGMLIGGRLRPGALYVEVPASPIGSNSGGGIEYILDNPSRDVAVEIIKQWDFTGGY